MRKAGQQLWNFYKNNSLAQDAIETGMWAGGSALGQALFTDMEAGEIAGATALGAGLAMGSRPLGRRGGAALGKMIDQRAPGLLADIEKFIPVTKKGRDAAVQAARELDMNPEAVAELLDAKRNQVAFNPDDTERGDAATMLAYYLGNRADNIVQGGVALLAPAFMGGDDE